jgi:predicted site-specific integrase-resolvase
MWTFEEIAQLFRVKLRTVYEWRRAGQFNVVVRRTGRFSVQMLVAPDEVHRLFNAKFAVPGDGSPAARIYGERIRRRRLAGLAASAKRWGKLKEQSSKS